MRTREKLQISTIVVLSFTVMTMILSYSGISDNKANYDELIHKAEATDIQDLQKIETKKTELHDVYTNIYNQVADSIVQVTSTRSNTNSHIVINGNPLEQQGIATGSGFVYDRLGHIITNHHVIDESTNVEVTFNSGNTYSVRVVGTDIYNDIAVLEITDDFSDEDITPLEFSDSHNIMVGEPAIAIGNPFGLSNTMTAGIISQTGRLLPNQDGGGFSIANVIQTDAAINPGNSGGPLLDISGKVIGMNTAIRTNTGEFSGIGFAVPSNTISKIVPILIKSGTYNHPWIGISGTDLNSKIAEMLNLTKNYRGVIIANIIQDSPADKAGMHEAVYNNKQEIKGADIIIATDGNPVKTMSDVIQYISEKNVGDKVLFTINREGKIMDISVILGSRPDA